MTKIRPTMRAAAALATLVLAALLIWQCIDIYMDGNAPENLDGNGVHITSVYTAEDVGSRLLALAPVGAAYVLLIVTAVAASGKAPADKQTLTPANRLRLMKKRVSELPEAALREEKLRRNVWLAAGAALLVCAALCLTYLLDGTHFISWDLEVVMGEMLLHVAPWVVLALAVVYAAYAVCDRSMLRECEALKGAPKSDGKKSQKPHAPVNAIRIVLYGAAIVFIVLGVMNGGLYDVLVKAINICTECIGLG